MTRSWTTGDLRRVAELAGTMPERELRRRLRLSKNQLRYAVATLRKMGVSVSTRYYEPRLEQCPSCGRMSATLGRHGICEPCRRRRQLAEIEARTAALLEQLPPEQRAVYEATEAETGSSPGPMPAAPRTEGMDAYDRAAAEEAHDEEMERWAARYLMRQVKAAQKRKERIQKKVDRFKEEHMDKLDGTVM